METPQDVPSAGGRCWGGGMGPKSMRECRLWADTSLGLEIFFNILPKQKMYVPCRVDFLAFQCHPSHIKAVLNVVFVLGLTSHDSCMFDGGDGSMHLKWFLRHQTSPVG